MTTAQETQGSNPYRTLQYIEDDGLAKALSQLDDMLSVQVEEIIGIIRQLRVTAAGAQRHYEEDMKLALMWAEEGKTHINRAVALEAYLLQQLQEHDVQRVDTGNGNAIVLERPPSCTVIDSALVPSEYRRVVPETFKVDQRGLIAQWLKVDNPLIFTEAFRGVEIKRGPAYLKIT